MNIFRTKFSENIFNYKYKHSGAETWEELSATLVEDVCRDVLSKTDKERLIHIHSTMQFIAGGRYLYYAGRPVKFFNNCYLLRSLEDTRQDWADLSWKAESCLTTGGGIGNDYSIYRAKGTPLKRTGGLASGPLSKAKMVNEIGREVMQGGSRRSAIYGSLNWQHADAMDWLYGKDWGSMVVPGAFTEDGKKATIGYLKEKDFNYPAPLDMTNISLNYDDAFLEQCKTGTLPTTFVENCRQALKTGEPGFSFNFGAKQNETLRNAPVSGNTKVLTLDGYVRVQDVIDKPINIWTGKNWAKDVVFNLTKKDSELVKVNLSNGRNIICSPEHPFICKNYLTKGKNKKIEIIQIPASELKVNQKLENSLPLDKIEWETNNQYALGFVYGDGSLKDGRGEISYHIENKKDSFIKTCKDLNAKISLTVPNRAYFKYNKPDKKSLLCDTLDNEFIAGWFDADGCYTRNLLRISCSDVEALYNLQYSLDFYGIKSIVREDGKSSYKPENKSYTLLVSSESLLRFKELIPTLRIKIDLDNNYKPYRELDTTVISIEYLPYKENVYCCDVKLEEHSFMAEGVIISNCTEVTSEDDSDVCNLGSVNMANIETIEQFAEACYLGGMFLLCGTLVAELPYQKVYDVRAKNRRLGLGLMGVHEWLLKRGYKYEVTKELHEWLAVYKTESERGANELADRIGINRPVAYRAIAPTGTIGIMAGTTTGIEPLLAVAFKRRYLVNGTEWHYQYVVDGTAKILIKQGIAPESIESALDLAYDYERRIKFQADIQDYVDMSISSTINMPKWGTKYNNNNGVDEFAAILAKYAPRLRGFTCYPDGSRGGQPLTIADYSEAIKHEGKEYKEEFHDICDISNRGGSCGV